MKENYTEDQAFDKNDFTQQPLPGGTYEHCTFNHCNFAGSDLSGIAFVDCSFTGCNLSLAKLHRTVFRDIQFKDCKMLGLRFDTCSEFGLSFAFDNCQLNHASFYKLKIKKTVFKHSQLQEVDFAESDLSGAVFDHCAMPDATFDRTILERADFRTATHFSIDPENNRIKKAKFSLSGLPGLLDKYELEIE